MKPAINGASMAAGLVAVGDDEARPRARDCGLRSAAVPTFFERVANLPALSDRPGTLSCLQARGQAARMDVGPYPVAYTGRPESVRVLLDGRLDGLAQRGRFYEDISRVLGPTSLVTCQGETDRRLRLALAPAFQKERVASYGALMVERSTARAANWPNRGQVALDREMAALTLDIAARSLFGVDIAQELSQFSTVLETGARIFYRLVLPRRMSDALWRNPYSPANRRLAAAQKQVDRFVRQLVAARRAEAPEQVTGRPPNLLDFLLETRHEEGTGLSEEPGPVPRSHARPSRSGHGGGCTRRCHGAATWAPEAPGGLPTGRLT